MWYIVFYISKLYFYIFINVHESWLFSNPVTNTDSMFKLSYFIILKVNKNIKFMVLRDYILHDRKFWRKKILVKLPKVG